ncbi:hypothetical protein COU54_00820 [Candidatus Pacearchaeota archaeon CG10_big_fil_rev_8_21_14_0_10_31_24]|nr:MAG: hypothetical protein COU54_00820 [Candidatus Pacearchaeota archaeon CG10_big_fil_rev_8_21_14_0_10_31_24]
MNTYVIAAALIKNKEKYLIAKRDSQKEFNPNEWEFISGFIEEKETVEKTILRELIEETNLKGQIIDSGESTSILDKDTRWIIIPYLIETNNEKFEINPSDHSEMLWVKAKSLKNYKGLISFIKIFENEGWIK